MKKKGKADEPKKLKPLDSGQWISESTMAPNSTAAKQSRSQSASQSQAPPPVDPSLHIYRDGVDVTGKTTKAFSGQTVTLTGVVKPKKYGATDWHWTAPSELVKNFKVKSVGGRDIEGKRIDYIEADFIRNSVSLHWVDGGGKNVTVKATVRGKEISASTTVDVTRPTVDILTNRQGPEISAPTNGFSVAFAQIDFVAAHLSHPGSLRWVQLGVAKNRVTDLNGHIIEDVTYNGLDGCHYPNKEGNSAQDAPQIAFLTTRDKTIERELEATMFLLWKSPKPGLFVPLKKVAWRFNGTLESTGVNSAPIWKTVAPPIINPNFFNEDPVDTSNYPEWINCFKVGG